MKKNEEKEMTQRLDNSKKGKFKKSSICQSQNITFESLIV